MSSFIIRNVNYQKNSISIFGINILFGGFYDLLTIQGINESIIMTSLASGDLKNLIEIRDIVVAINTIGITIPTLPIAQITPDNSVNPSIYYYNTYVGSSTNTINSKFIVQNINWQGKTLSILGFNLKINQAYNLLYVSGVTEAIIKNSLLKGELKDRIELGDIRVVESDLDLSTLNTDQITFLESAGITQGVAYPTGFATGGVTGPQGATGPQGIQGVTGPPGPPGTESLIEYSIPTGITQLINWSNGKKQKSWVGSGGVLYSAIGATGPANFMLKIITVEDGPITWATGPTGFVWPDGIIPTIIIFASDSRY